MDRQALAYVSGQLAVLRKRAQTAVPIARAAVRAYRAANRTPDDEAAAALREAAHVLICAARGLSVYGWWDDVIDGINRGDS
jgi:hypothetical protein